MCGLFGMIGIPQDKNLIAYVLNETGRRGPNAWGVAWKDTGGLTRYSKIGSLRDHTKEVLFLLTQTTEAMIGQARLATSGTYKNTNNNQPIVVSDGTQKIAISHNGNVYNTAQLIQEYNLSPQTQCDSEVLGLLVLQSSGNLLERTVSSLDLIDTRSPLALIIMSETEMVLIRKGQPLFQMETEASTIFCSRPVVEIGDKRTQLQDHYAWLWSLPERRCIRQQEIM